jgi:hypothetical protein
MKSIKSKKNKLFKNIDWRINFMKVLETLYFEELTWSSGKWENFGVSPEDKIKIEEEFEKHMSRPGSKMKFHLDNDGGPRSRLDFKN